MEINDSESLMDIEVAASQDQGTRTREPEPMTTDVPNVATDATDDDMSESEDHDTFQLGNLSSALMGYVSEQQHDVMTPEAFTEVDLLWNQKQQAGYPLDLNHIPTHLTSTHTATLSQYLGQ